MAKLKKGIGKKTLFLLSVNSIIGTGIFFLPAAGAEIAGPASIISWVMASIAAIFFSLYFAELVSLYPKSGGVYEYTKKAFGEKTSFIVGWGAWLITNITIAMLVVGSILYLVPDISIVLKVVISISLLIFFNIVSYVGINWAGKLLVFFGLMTLISILSIIIPGSLQFNIGNLKPFFVFPASSIFLAIYFIVETFFGWETATYLSEEVKNAKKVMPRMLVIATVFVVLLSVGLVVVALGIADWRLFSTSVAPMNMLSSLLFGGGVSKIFSLIIFVPLLGTAASWIISSPRLLYAMSRDKVLPKGFSAIHDKFDTPHKAILFQTITSIVVTLIAFGNYMTLLSLLVPLVMIVYSFVVLSVWKLRIKKPRLKRFKAPFGKVGPFCLTIFNAFILGVWIFEVRDALAIFSSGVILVLLGIPLYFLIKLETDKKFTEKFFDKVSFIWDILFPFWYGEKEIKRVIRGAKIKKGDKVMDFGCGTGLTTLKLTKKIGDEGTVVAVDLSRKQLEKSIKKVEKAMEFSNVVFIKETELIPFEKNFFDSVVGVGVLEHFSDPQDKLKQVFKLLKKNGRFSFLSFGRSFGIPAPDHLKSKKDIKKLFESIASEVKIERKKKRGSEYWFIHGKK